jgi:hypothetical protein
MEFTFKASIEPEFFKRMLVNEIRNYIKTLREEETIGISTFDDNYWYKNGLFDIIGKEFEKLIDEFGLLDELNIAIKEEAEVYDEIEVFYHLSRLGNLNFNTLETLDWLERLNMICNSKKVDNFVFAVNYEVVRWKKIFETYERLQEANARATLIRSLYNPRTKLGYIHINRLYTDNFD